MGWGRCVTMNIIIILCAQEFITHYQQKTWNHHNVNNPGWNSTQSTEHKHSRSLPEMVTLRHLLLLRVYTIPYHKFMLCRIPNKCSDKFQKTLCKQHLCMHSNTSHTSLLSWWWWGNIRNVSVLEWIANTGTVGLQNTITWFYFHSGDISPKFPSLL